MEPELARLFDRTDANIAQAIALAGGLSRQQFNWRSEAGRWSIGECVTHLNLIDGEDLPRSDAALDAVRTRGITGHGPFQYGRLATWFANSMEPPVTRKFKSPKQYRPPADSDPAETLAAYRRTCDQLQRLIKKSDGLDLARIKVGLSGVPMLKMSLGARFKLLAAHDRRHLWQAEQMRKHPAFPSSG